MTGGAEGAGVYAFFRLELPEGGGLPTAEVLSRRARCAKPAGAPDFGPAPDAHRIRRLRRSRARPVAVEEIWLDGRARRRSRRPLSECLYLHYRRHLGSGSCGSRTGSASMPVPAGRRWPVAGAGDVVRPRRAHELGAGRRACGIFPHLVRPGQRALRRAAEIGDRCPYPPLIVPPRSPTGRNPAAELRHHRLRHDGAGASAQHRAAARRARSPRSSSPTRRCAPRRRRWRRGARTVAVAGRAAGGAERSTPADRSARTISTSTRSRQIAARRPLPLLVEKPLYTDPADAAARRGALRAPIPRPIWVAMEYRYMPPIATFLQTRRRRRPAACGC